MKNSIRIITSKPETLMENYVIARLMSHWQGWGHTVTVGPTKILDADIGIMHIDLTRVDPACVPEILQQQSLLNRQVLDISKNRFSTLQLFRESVWDGPVIVKSNLNYFGAPEKKLHKEGFFERKRRKLARKSWRFARMLPVNEYPVLPDISAVPAWVWKHKDMIVERFLPERDGDLYSIRGWLFFGDRGYAYRLFSKSPVVKAGTITHFEILDTVPPELESFRRAHGFDFGKFDYVEVEGRPVVIDMNKTPTTVAKPDSPRLLDLAEGIYSFPGMKKP